MKVNEAKQFYEEKKIPRYGLLQTSKGHLFTEFARQGKTDPQFSKDLTALGAHIARLHKEATTTDKTDFFKQKVIELVKHHETTMTKGTNAKDALRRLNRHFKAPTLNEFLKQTAIATITPAKQEKATPTAALPQQRNKPKRLVRAFGALAITASAIAGGLFGMHQAMKTPENQLIRPPQIESTIYTPQIEVPLFKIVKMPGKTWADKLAAYSSKNGVKASILDYSQEPIEPSEVVLTTATPNNTADLNKPVPTTASASGTTDVSTKYVPKETTNPDIDPTEKALTERAEMAINKARSQWDKGNYDMAALHYTRAIYFGRELTGSDLEHAHALMNIAEPNSSYSIQHAMQDWHRLLQKPAAKVEETKQKLKKTK